MITNIVCNADLQCPIDLKLLTLRCGNITYNPQNFSAAIWRHKRIGGTCMVFDNGKIMVNGKVNSTKEAKQRLRRYARLIQKLGWKIYLKQIVISTISAFFKLDGPVDVLKLVPYYNGAYESELFPAAMFVKDSIHFTCFHTGSVLMTGIKHEQQFYTTVIPVLLEIPLL